jgi:excisionase family DNA binding protein
MGYSILEKRFLNMDECAEFLGVTKGTLYAWVCYRKIPYLKVGRLVKFDLRSIEEWLKARAVVQLN